VARKVNGSFRGQTKIGMTALRLIAKNEDIRSGLFISYIARQAGEDPLHRSIRIFAKAANVLQSTSCAPYAIGTSACGHEADLTFAHGQVR
jgi:hypothetical protein